MKNRRIAAVCLGISACSGLAAPAWADDCTDRFESLREWARSAEPAPFVATVRVWRRPAMTEAQALAALANIEGIVDHPSRAELERALVEARNDGWNDEYTFWYLSETQQRVAIKTLHPDPDAVGRTDLAVNRRTAWSLGESSMTLVDTRRPPPQSDLGQAAQDIARSMVNSLAVTGLNPHLDDARVVSCQTTPDGRWTGRLAWADGASEIEVTGTVQPGGDLRVEKVRVTKTDAKSGVPNTHTRLSDFAYNPAWGRPMAQLSEVIGGDGRPVRRVQLVSIEPLDPAEAESYLIIPEDGGTDPLVGPVSLRTYSDKRPGGKGSLYRQGDTWIPVESLRQGNGALSQSESKRPLIAAVAAGIVVIGVLAWFLVRRMKA
ncbi:MAG: hypothetical protein LAT64_05265 [Phycisphaerales bacterium]|nr:hypothetical protein [Planctomycetota bacterium]MCH8508164.1 hypothetical protein [Phycisphaerales bacterium]